MRKILLLVFIASISSFFVFAQDFSNKGKDFWVGYGNHVRMFNSGTPETMQIYLTSDQNTSGIVTIASIAFSQTFSVTANQITVINIPRAAALLDEGLYNHGIHITALKPIIAYGFIYVNAVSGATVFLPTNTLGKEYYSLNYKQLSNEANSYSYFFVEATEPGSTIIEIKPSQTTKGGWPANVTQTITLTQGQIYQVLSLTDLTGSTIKSIASGTGGCKKIAVFCGSGKISTGCAGVGVISSATGSSDNLYQQMYPTSTWGKKYILVASENKQTGTPAANFIYPITSRNIFRIFRPDPTAVVSLNGVVIPSGSFVNNSYDFQNGQTNLVESDKGILVAQYFTSANSSGCPSGNNNPYDPEMIYLNPVEQTITDVTVNSMQPAANTAITQHFINVVVKNAGTGLSSFKIDGITPPASSFTVLPQDNNYSYTRIWKNGGSIIPTDPALSPGAHRLSCDSGFNAIAYGFGSAESYGYSAGTNLKDLYQQISVQSQYGIEASPSICTNSPFRFRVSLPYCADSIQWNLSSLPGPPTPTNPKIIYSSCAPGANGPDSTTIVNGKVIYWYSLPSIYSFPIAGLFPVTITAYNTGLTLCGTAQDIDFELGVFDPPNAGFTNNQPGCIADPVQFYDTTATVKPNYRWNWNFGDPGSGASNTSTLQNPVHTFSTSGPHTVTLITTTTVGCFSNQASKIINVPAMPTATVSGTNTLCINSATPNITFTGSEGISPYVFSYHINSGPIQTITSTGTVASLPVNTTVAGTYTYYLDSVKNLGSSICNQPQVGSVVVNITPDATLALSSSSSTANQTVCNNTSIVNIIYAVGGSGTGGSVTGLPAGVTGTYSNGVFTITGTPTASGAFTYTVSTTGPCVTPTMTGTINVTADGTLTLTSASSTTNQTLCINTPLTDITYAVGGSSTGGSVTGLPAGITGTYAGGVITITGTPTVSGTFNYTVFTTGPCLTPIATGIINVTPDATIALSSAAPTTNQTVCINNAITNITYAVGGSGTGGSVTGLPAGVTGTYASGVITISGSPAVAGIFNYTVSTTGPCITPSMTGTINVTADGTLTLTSASSTTNQTLCINTPLTDITYSVSGSGTGGSVTGLPAGITGTYAGGVITITGTPTVSGTFNYTVLTTGPCVTPTMTGTINVTADGTIALSSPAPTANQTVCINNAITNITYAVGGSGTGGSVTGLPSGVTGTYASGVITISGSPVVGGIFNYTVSTTGPCVTPTMTGTINVTADGTLTLTSAISTTNQTLCINTPLTDITYAVGGSSIGGSVTGLPAGITGTYAGGVITITGTPTVSGTFNYTLFTTGPCVNPTATGTINVTQNTTIALTSAVGSNNQNLCINVPITNITYGVGGSGTGGSVSGLPSGVTGTYSSGVITISGSPIVTGVFNYTVSTTGPCVNPAVTGTIKVNPDASITLTSGSATNNQMLCNNQPITPINYQIGGGGTGATVNGLPAGVTGTYIGNVFTISGTPTVSGLFNYTVSTTGTCIQNNAAGSILVHPKPTASFTTVGPYCSELAVTFTPAFGITPTGSVVSWVWDYGDGFGPQIRTNGNPFTVTYATAGIKNVTFKTISDNGCVSTVFAMPVTINSKPVAGFINPGACLADANAQFYDTSTVAGGTIVFWSWDFGDGSPIFAGTGTTYQNPIHAYSTVGQKTVTLIVTTNSGCKDTVVQQFFINGEVTRAAFITQNPNNLCSNRPVQIKENSLVNVGFLIRTDIYWDYVGAPTVFDQDNTPTPNKIYTHSYPNLQIDKTYRIRYFAYSGFNGVCQKDTIIDIIVRASPVAQFLPVPDVCLNGGTVVLNQGSASGGTGVYMGPGVTFSGGVYTFNPLASGVVVGTNNGVVYTVTSPTGCDSAKVQQIKVLAPPVVNSFAPVGNICNNNSITFHNTYTNGDGTVTKWIYNWNDASPIQTMTTGADVTHVYTTIGSHTATLTLETDYGCRNIPFQVTFTVNPLPVPAYTFSNSVCLPNASVVFTNMTPNVSENTYLWSFELPSTSPANTSTLTTGPSHTYTTQGPFNTNLVATNIATGCVGTSVIKVIDGNTIHPEPVVQFTAISDVCLNNGTVQLTQGSETSGMPGGPGVYSGPGISPSGLFDPIAAGVGTHTLTYTWTSSFNCPSSLTQSIKVLAPPVVNSFAPLGNICHNNAITFHQTYTNGDGTVIKWIYDWNDASPIQTMTTGADVTHVYTTSGPHMATLTLETDYGCRNTPFPANFTVNPLPAPTYTFSNSVCLPNATVVFTNTTPNTSENTYLWSFELPSTSPANTSTLTTSASHIYTTQGPFNTNLVATNIMTGCVGTSATAIIDANTIHPEPVIQFTAISDVCLNNGTLQLTQGSETSGMPGGPGIYSGPGVSPSGLFDPIAAGVGTYTLTYTWTSSFNCPSSRTQTIKVLAPPAVNTFTTVGNRCETQSVVFQNTVTQGAGTINTWIYDWGDGSPLTTVTNGNNITHTYVLPGTYPATLTLVTDYGCKSAPAFPLSVVVNPLPRPDFTYTDTTCLPQAKVIFVNTTPNISDWAYNWNFDIPSTNPADQSTQIQNVSYTYTTFGPHDVKLTATSGLTGCTAFKIKPITTIHKAPVASFNISKPTICVNQSITVTNNSTTPDGPITSWLWNFGDNTSPAQGQVQPPHTYTSPGTDSIRLTITNSFGCKDDSVRSVIIYPYPVVDAGPNTFVLEGGSTILQASATGNELTYLWSASTPVTHLSSNNVLQPVASPVSDVRYTLTVTARGGCAASDTVFVKVLKLPAIPNTFTPNNDGIHDLWEIQYLNSYPQNKVQVFTRDGKLVFESKGYGKPWNGTMNGKSLPVDTYYYIIEPGSGRKPITGFVTIIK